MMRVTLRLIRATAIACIYTVTLGCLYAARLFWTSEGPRYETLLLRLRVAAETVLRMSPAIAITS